MLVVNHVIGWTCFYTGIVLINVSSKWKIVVKTHVVRILNIDLQE